MLRRYLVTRVAQLIPLLFVILTIDFVIIHSVPGDPAIAIGGPTADQAFLDSVRKRFGLDKPLIEQYFIYMSNVIQGDLGFSYQSRRPVLDVVLERVGPTLLLMLTAWTASLMLGILLGTFAGMRKGAKADRALSIGALTLYSIPVFWLALMTVLMFGLNLRWFPISGMMDTVNPRQGIELVFDIISHMALPIIIMIAFYMPQFFMLTRSSVIDTQDEDFVKTLQATGLQYTTIGTRYVVKNASLPVVTLAGLWLGYSLTGAVLIEVIFGWPGLGRLLFDSAITRDYPVLLGVFFVASLMVVGVMLLTDIVYVYLDPRVRYGKQGV